MLFYSLSYTKHARIRPQPYMKVADVRTRMFVADGALTFDVDDRQRSAFLLAQVDSLLTLEGRCSHRGICGHRPCTPVAADLGP